MDTTEGRDAFGRFKPGYSGNPLGRTPGSVGLAEAIRAELDQADDEGRTAAQRIAEKLVAMAIAGDLRAIQLVAERIEGRPRAAEDRQPIDRIEFKPLEF